MTILRYNLVHTRLAASIDNDDTTITLESALQEGGVNVPTLAGGDTIILGIDDELVALTAYTAGATTGTITRGYGDTLAAAHDTGAVVGLTVTKDDIRVGSTLLHQWTQDNAAAAQTDAVLVLNAGVRTEVTMPRGGHVVGISIRSNAARSAGTLTVEPTINGTKVGLQGVLNGTDTQTDTARQDPGVDTFTAGQRIGVKLTTDGSWAPTTADVDVAVEVILDD